jgi:hypothetical protein
MMQTALTNVITLNACLIDTLSVPAALNMQINEIAEISSLNMAQDEHIQRPATGVSRASSATTIPYISYPSQTADHPVRGEDADLEKEDKVIQDEWGNDPANARNWSPGRKWTVVLIVGSFLLCTTC